MDDPDIWRWIWLIAAVSFTIGEAATVGTFFLLPFGIGAAVATVAAFVGMSVPAEWVAFVVVSGVGYLLLGRLGQRLDDTEPAQGIGSRRLIGEKGVVVRALPGGPTETGTVRVGREEWRAATVDGDPVPEGATVSVVEVRGTRLIVWPEPPEGPTAGHSEPAELPEERD